MVVFSFSILDRKHLFGANLVQKVKIFSLVQAQKKKKKKKHPEKNPYISGNRTFLLQKGLIKIFYTNS